MTIMYNFLGRAIQAPPLDNSSASLEKESTLSSKNFGDLMVQKGKDLFSSLESKGKEAESLTLGAINGHVSELDHITGLKDFERSLSLGEKTIEKFIEAYKELGRILG